MDESELRHTRTRVENIKGALGYSIGTRGVRVGTGVVPFRIAAIGDGMGIAVVNFLNFRCKIRPSGSAELWFFIYL